MKILSCMSLIFAVMTLSHCTTPARSRVESRLVTIPSNLDKQERAHLRAATEVLVDFGFTPTSSAGKEYALWFDIEEGPINVDTIITLTHHGEEIARGEGRDGGPHILFDRSGVIRSSVEEAAADFEDHIERIVR